METFIVHSQFEPKMNLSETQIHTFICLVIFVCLFAYELDLAFPSTPAV